MSMSDESMYMVSQIEDMTRMEISTDRILEELSLNRDPRFDDPVKENLYIMLPNRNGPCMGDPDSEDSIGMHEGGANVPEVEAITVPGRKNLHNSLQ